MLRVVCATSQARALIADEIAEGARDGRSVAELMDLGAGILTTDDVLPGVARPREAKSNDPIERSIVDFPCQEEGCDFATVGEIFDDATNPGRKKPFPMRGVMAALVEEERIVPLVQGQKTAHGDTSPGSGDSATASDDSAAVQNQPVRMQAEVTRLEARLRTRLSPYARRVCAEDAMDASEVHIPTPYGERCGPTYGVGVVRVTRPARNAAHWRPFFL